MGQSTEHHLQLKGNRYCITFLDKGNMYKKNTPKSKKDFIFMLPFNSESCLKGPMINNFWSTALRFQRLVVAVPCFIQPIQQQQNIIKNKSPSYNNDNFKAFQLPNTSV